MYIRNDIQLRILCQPRSGSEIPHIVGHAIDDRVVTWLLFMGLMTLTGYAIFLIV